MKRRKLISGVAGATILGGLAYWKRDALMEAGMKTFINNEGLIVSENNVASCKLTPEQTEGPFYVNAPIRSNIKEHCKGMDFELQIEVVSDNTCAPIEQAVIEIWHCDAQGTYSRYPPEINRSLSKTLEIINISDPTGHAEPTNDKTYLRGAQATDESGKVTFQTIVPGWYSPRAPHIHVKLHLAEDRQFITQIYFPQDITDRLYSSHPNYIDGGPAGYDHLNDMVISQYKGARGLVAPMTENAGKYFSMVRLVV